MLFVLNLANRGGRAGHCCAGYAYLILILAWVSSMVGEPKQLSQAGGVWSGILCEAVEGHGVRRFMQAVLLFTINNRALLEIMISILPRLLRILPCSYRLLLNITSLTSKKEETITS